MRPASSTVSKFLRLLSQFAFAVLLCPQVHLFLAFLKAASWFVLRYGPGYCPMRAASYVAKLASHTAAAAWVSFLGVCGVLAHNGTFFDKQRMCLMIAVTLAALVTDTLPLCLSLACVSSHAVLLILCSGGGSPSPPPALPSSSLALLHAPSSRLRPHRKS